jgi:hypothetical protein
MCWLLVSVRTLWTLPTTALGLGVAALGTPWGTRWRMRAGVIECWGGPITWLLAHATLLAGGALALTLGDVILGQNEAALDLCRAHEHVHVRQAHAWGPLFVPAYLAASAWLYLRGREAYRGNPFERAAYRISDARAGDAPNRQ